MNHRFEQVFYELFNNLARYIRMQPLNLGGYAASGGGQGGPPGGFVGMLPQTRVAYDVSELATLATPTSGESLLDNLNHIRYRLGLVEGSGNAGIDVYQDGISVAPGIHIVDFVDRFEVIPIDDGAQISLLASGILSDISTSGIYGEDLTSQIDGIEDHFDIAGTIYDASLAVYLNGVRQSTSTYVVDGDSQGFTTDFVPISGDTLFVDYVAAMDAYFHTHHQYVISGTVYTKEETLELLTAFSRTVNQQIVFTVASSGTLISGTLPLRIYAHDVNDGATISEVFVAFNTPPVTEVRMNVLKNGSTIFSAPSYISIASGLYTASKTTGFYDDTFIKNDYFQIKVEKGDNVASDMTLHVRFSYLLD